MKLLTKEIEKKMKRNENIQDRSSTWTVGKEDLSRKIAKLFRRPEVDVEYDGQTRMNTDITISKMSKTQVYDLLAMIEYFEGEKSPMWILANVMHDIQGIAKDLCRGPHGFSPRSTGYLERLGKKVKNG